MSKRALFVLLFAAVAATAMQSQKLPTATKTLDIQAGGDFVYGHSDYGTRLKGYGIYSTIDFKPHFGVELDLHQGNGTDQIYERTYEVGARYMRHYGRFSPYAKVMVGRGVFNFPPYPTDPAGGPRANLAYNMFALGGGTDYKLKSYLNLRADFEYQDWASDRLELQHGLTPYLLSIGAAYHFR